MDELLRLAALQPGLEQVHLCVVTTNEAALKLYRSCGFVIYGQDPAALKIGDTRHDEFLMVRRLFAVAVKPPCFV